MPAAMILASAGYGGAYGLFPIGWIVLNVIFLYQLTNECGLFERLRHSITGLTQDRRLQLLLVAFSFGAFIEGACGFGTPVAVTGAILIGLGFSPLSASGLSLIANTAPVAFGALGAPLHAKSCCCHRSCRHRCNAASERITISDDCSSCSCDCQAGANCSLEMQPCIRHELPLSL